MPWQRPPAWLYLPHLTDSLTVNFAEGGENGCDAALDREPETIGEEERIGAGTTCGSAIRGRVASPGRGRGCEEQRFRDDGIRGLGHEPGPADTAARSRAVARLEASHSRIWRSLEDHRERVEKRRREVDTRVPTACGTAPSAGERLAALRRRVEQKVHGRGADAANAAREAAWHALGDLPGPPAAAGVDRQLSGV